MVRHSSDDNFLPLHKLCFLPTSSCLSSCLQKMITLKQIVKDPSPPVLYIVRISERPAKRLLFVLCDYFISSDATLKKEWLPRLARSLLSLFSPVGKEQKGVLIRDCRIYLLRHNVQQTISFINARLTTYELLMFIFIVTFLLLSLSHSFPQTKYCVIYFLLGLKLDKRTSRQQE